MAVVSGGRFIWVLFWLENMLRTFSVYAFNFIGGIIFFFFCRKIRLICVLIGFLGLVSLLQWEKLGNNLWLCPLLKNPGYAAACEKLIEFVWKIRIFFKVYTMLESLAKLLLLMFYPLWYISITARLTIGVKIINGFL